MLFEGQTPEMQPSRMPAIIAAGIVGIALAILWAVIGVKGGAIPALVNIAAVSGTYKLVRKNQLEKYNSNR
jgi:type III secretory pathway component EscS